MTFKKSLKIILTIIIILFVCIATFLIVLTVRVSKGKELALNEIANTHYNKMSFNGTVKKLTILPLIDFYAVDKDLKTEAGVSYLIKADNTVILFDVGCNSLNENPSPLINNMQKLGIDIRDIGLVFISHPHMDHIGGMTDQRNGTFSLTQGKVDIKSLIAYTTENLKASPLDQNITIRKVNAPILIKNGIASTGTIPRSLFLLGMVHEQCLAINVENKGIVLIIGCGHPSVERIIERSKAIFKEQIYAIIGGIHFPINGGRLNIGPLNLQYIGGKDSPPWAGLDMNDLESAIQCMKNANPTIIALSPHDSSDWALIKFADVFKDKFSIIKVGKVMQL